MAQYFDFQPGVPGLGSYGKKGSVSPGQSTSGAQGGTVGKPSAPYQFGKFLRNPFQPVTQGFQDFKAGVTGQPFRAAPAPSGPPIPAPQGPAGGITNTPYNWAAGAATKALAPAGNAALGAGAAGAAGAGAAGAAAGAGGAGAALGALAAW